MKLITTLLLPALSLAQIAATSQTPAPAKPHTATATHTAASASRTGCVKLPPLSPTIPALPAGTPCAKPLYTLTTQPSIKIDFVSPLEGTALQDTLGLTSDSFSLAYIDTKVGTGEPAAPGKYYSIQYTGYLIDGTKFDSSLDKPGQEPFTFPYGKHQVVAGWDTGFAGMHVGGKRRLFIPSQLAYGPQGHGSIPAKAMLIFDVEFISQSDTPPAPKPAPAPPAAAMPKPATPPPATTPPPSAQPVPATPPDATAPKPQ